MDKNSLKEQKFLNCEYRSENEETVTIQRCACNGGNYTESGYRCSKRDIFKVTSEICDYCSDFKKK
jgi:hypothetical protein